MGFSVRRHQLRDRCRVGSCDSEYEARTRAGSSPSPAEIALTQPAPGPDAPFPEPGRLQPAVLAAGRPNLTGLRGIHAFRSCPRGSIMDLVHQFYHIFRKKASPHMVLVPRQDELDGSRY